MLALWRDAMVVIFYYIQRISMSVLELPCFGFLYVDPPSQLLRALWLTFSGVGVSVDWLLLLVLLGPQSDMLHIPV